MTLLFGITASLMLGLVATALSRGSDNRFADQPASKPSVYHLHTDHATFADLADLREASDRIVIGTVLSSTIVPGGPPGTDSLGVSLPPIPHTDYLLAVDRVLKGGFGVAGQRIIVSLSGGTVPAGDFVLDGGPKLDVGHSYLFFLDSADDGKHYPLAGGAAVAAKQTDGTFLLPGESTGLEAQALTVDEVAPPLTLMVERARLDFRKHPHSERARIHGTFALAEGIRFRCGSEVDIGLDPPAVTRTFTRAQRSRAGSMCRYQDRGPHHGHPDALVLDLKRQTFDLRIRKADLSHITNPVAIVMQLGISQGSEELTMQEHDGFWDYRRRS